uniref:Uncharacterized protein n=1 Tax=Romanomermis culicivorax TaxID=13658 RepID=A0A915I5V4_ROMCU
MNAAAAVDEDFVKDYATSLDELTTNSKPHINML